jgi:hypothetical protein
MKVVPKPTKFWNNLKLPYKPGAWQYAGKKALLLYKGLLSLSNIEPGGGKGQGGPRLPCARKTVVLSDSLMAQAFGQVSAIGLFPRRAHLG